MKQNIIKLMAILLISSIFSLSYGLESNQLFLNCKKFIELTEDHGLSLNISEANDPNILLAVGSSFCGGYINGFRDNHFASKSKFELNYCLPNDTSIYSLAKAYVKYLEDHPEMLNEYSSSTFPAAMSKYFPCNNTQ